MEKVNDSFNDIVQNLDNSHLDSFWKGFHPVAYALFNKKHVYLFNHPKMKKEPNENYQMLKRDDQFVGCTLILYQDYPTAIVDLELYEDHARLYSMLVHELFHGFQYIKGENRFADEVMGVTYPLLKENIQMRSQERLYLYRAVVEKDRKKKREYLSIFVSLREKRGAIIDEYLGYENLTETIEGPAGYVEFKSFLEKSEQAYPFILETYGKQLLDHFDSALHIRKSCYYSGLFLCLLLDEFDPEWKGNFWDEEKTIYELLKQLSSYELVEICEHKENVAAENIIADVLDNRKRIIDDFEQQKGIDLSIKGKITVKSFDPMNIVVFDDKVLHKNFLKVEINNQDYLIEQPVIAYCKDGLRDILKLDLVLRKRPVENDDALLIHGVGLVKGTYKQMNKTLHVNEFH